MVVDCRGYVVAEHSYAGNTRMQTLINTVLKVEMGIKNTCILTLLD